VRVKNWKYGVQGVVLVGGVGLLVKMYIHCSFIFSVTSLPELRKTSRATKYKGFFNFKQQ
jgi:hypothetical protein